VPVFVPHPLVLRHHFHPHRLPNHQPPDQFLRDPIAEPIHVRDPHPNRIPQPPVTTPLSAQPAPPASPPFHPPPPTSPPPRARPPEPCVPPATLLRTLCATGAPPPGHRAAPPGHRAAALRPELGPCVPLPTFFGRQGHTAIHFARLEA